MTHYLHITHVHPLSVYCNKLFGKDAIHPPLPPLQAFAGLHSGSNLQTRESGQWRAISAHLPVCATGDDLEFLGVITNTLE